MLGKKKELMIEKSLTTTSTAAVMAPIVAGVHA